MENSRRDLSNDMAKHMPILKSNQNTCHPRFGNPKQVKHSPKRFFVTDTFYSLRSYQGEISDLGMSHSSTCLNSWL